MKNRAARHTELLPAILAAPDRPRAIAVHVDIAAMWAVGLPIVVGPAYCDELRVRFLVTHPQHGR